MGKDLAANRAMASATLSFVLVAAPGLPNAHQAEDTSSNARAQVARRVHPALRLSSSARSSAFARAHGIETAAVSSIGKGAENLAEQSILQAAARGIELSRPDPERDEPRAGAARQVNADWNGRPQRETSVAVHPSSGQWVVGANDGGIGNPSGGGVYSSEGVNYFPPFPALVGFVGTDVALIEPPISTSDPALAYGLTRSGPGVPAGIPVAYYASLGFSATFCENGVFVHRSFDNGANWSRPVVPQPLAPKGLGTAAYHDQVLDCSIFHDKDYIAVDTTGGPHNGRVYVTWTRFAFTDAQTNTIEMSYSDDNAQTFSDPIVISGHSDALCPTVIPAGALPGLPLPIGTPGGCDVDQFSYPVVMPDGTLAVSFENGQPPTALVDGLRGQILVTKVNPDSLAISGPYRVADVFDGIDDLPLNANGFPTLCNSNFFAGISVGNLAVDEDGHLYVVWFDDRARAGQFPFPTFVGGGPSYACPPGHSTDADVFLSRSTDSGVTWSAPILVSPVKPGTGERDQFQAWVASGPRGRVDVAFYDRRLDPNNTLADTFVARSKDGGQTFEATRASRFASDFNTAGTFIGDYIGMTMDRFGTSYAVWTGVKPGKRDSDIFMAVMDARDRDD